MYESRREVNNRKVAYFNSGKQIELTQKIEDKKPGYNYVIKDGKKYPYTEKSTAGHYKNNINNSGDRAFLIAREDEVKEIYSTSKPFDNLYEL